MKCGSCRSTTSDVYRKIQNDNDLMEILKRLNPNQIYNPKYFYFCDDCVLKAKDQQASSLTTVNSQNAKTFSDVNASKSSNGSDSSKDEYDMLVASKIVFSDKGTPLHIPPSHKRTTDQSNTRKPCPKRFRIPLAPLQLPTIGESSKSSVTHIPHTRTKPCPKRFKSILNASLPEASRTDITNDDPDENVSSEREQNKSDSIRENDFILLFESDESSQSADKQIRTSSRRRHPNGTLSSNVSPDALAIIPSTRTSGTFANKPKSPVLHSSESSDSDVPESNNQRTKESTRSPQQKAIPSRGAANNPKTPVRHSSESSDSDIPDSNNRSKTVSTRPRTIRSFFPLREVLPGPSAPAVKNPRIRQPISAANTIRNTLDYFNSVNNTIQVHDFPRLLAG